VTWPQLGLHAKPCGIQNILGYYSPLFRMFDHAVEEPETGESALVVARASPAELLKALQDWRPTHIEKWLDRKTR
jgi:predicted Rossmann-fold nucleotide-binding protein